MANEKSFSYANRELSWLAFNERILQEAEDTSVPLFERINFLAIYSSNLDEYFRVRVASLRNLLHLSEKSLGELDFNPAKLLGRIQKIVERHHERGARIWSEDILPRLRAEGIHLINERAVSSEDRELLLNYFDRDVRPHLDPVRLHPDREPPFLKNQQLYLVVELFPQQSAVPVFAGSPALALVNIPTDHVPRFKVIRGTGGKQHVLFLDDIIRLNMARLYSDVHAGAAYSITLSRDAEVYLEDEFAGNLIEKIRKGVEKREFGRPCRFLYDPRTPYETVLFLKDHFDLEDEDLVAGGRYHNLRDLVRFPRFDLGHLSYPPRTPVPHPALETADSPFKTIRQKDRLVVFPYQPFKYITEFLRAAARDAKTERVWISLYRLSDKPAVVEPIISAVRNGKKVTAFIEAKARFNETSNLYWADRLEAEGVHVLYSLPGLKVHAKLAAVERREGSSRRTYAYLSTGNFNESTARQFSDIGLFTADRSVTADVKRVFEFLQTRGETLDFETLVVSPVNMRATWYELIDREIAHARRGHRAQITLKLNSLTDREIITRLYEASNRGVRIRLLVRGICRLVPDIEGQSENIEARSIVDRYLEHARVFWFHNKGNPEFYAGSADWMERNLNRRVEVAFPVADEEVQRDLRTILELQWADNTKSRLIDEKQTNTYVSREGKPAIRSQEAIYEYFQEKLNGQTSGTGASR